MLRETGIEELRFFIPHEEGRGASLHEVRCREEDMKNWSEEAKTLLNRTIYRTEAEWLAEKEQVPPENRALLLSLTKDNIARLEKTAFSAVLRELEDLDEAYYRTVPSERELAERYGNKENTALYRRRDLFQKYRKQYLAENRLNPYDVTDERQSGSRRY